MKEALIPVAEALSRVLAAADEPLSEEWVALEEAFGRTLSRDLVAARTQPPFANSAMDGYALRAADVKEPPASLKLIGESAAGRAFAGAVGAGEAVRIFTGAPIPEGADTIVIQEDVRREGERIVIAVSAKPGDNIRVAGLDFAAGETLLSAGTRLGPRAVALAAAANHRSLPVRRRPRVAILATGDELVAPGEPLGPSQIVASNNFFIAGLVEANGGIPIDLGIAIDQPSALAAKILAARDAEADVLVTLGGASVGDYDLVQKALVDAGMQLGFWRIAMRPGKPLMHGRLGAMRVLGLPGNPTSSAVCGVLFLRPLLRALLGDASAGADPSEPARLAAPLPANGIRQDYMRATLARDDDGRWLAAPLPDQELLAREDDGAGGGADRAAARGAGGAGRRGLPGDQVGADGGVAPRPLVATHGQQSIRRPPIRRPRSRSQSARARVLTRIIGRSTTAALSERGYVSAGPDVPRPPSFIASFSKSRLFCSKLFQTFLWSFCGISMGYKAPKPKESVSKFFGAADASAWPLWAVPDAVRWPRCARQSAGTGPKTRSAALLTNVISRSCAPSWSLLTMSTTAPYLSSRSRTLSRGLIALSFPLSTPRAASRSAGSSRAICTRA